MAEITLEVHADSVAIRWDELISKLPNVHILQSSHWAAIKAGVGWQSDYLLWKDTSGSVKAAALVLIKSIPLLSRLKGSCILYIPRGPLLDWSDFELRSRVLDDLISYAREKKGVFIKIDPELQVGNGLPGSDDYLSVAPGSEVFEVLNQTGWEYSSSQVQFRNTVLLDLCLSEAELLGRMKQKTRYNIALAGRKGVVVRRGDENDFPVLYRMYVATALRDGFAIRDKKYYTSVWSRLFRDGLAVPLLAEVEGETVSGMVMFMYAARAYYFYGMSTGEHREKMPNHLLQWEAIRSARENGCTVYDFWGAPDSFNENDILWGVYRFKEGFNGQTVAGLGAWDYILNPQLFFFYQRIIPAVLKVMRVIGRQRIAQEINQ